MKLSKQMTVGACLDRFLLFRTSKTLLQLNHIPLGLIAVFSDA